MITLKEAIKTIEREMPDYKVFGCSENRTFYFFDMQPKRLWGTNEIPSGGSTYVVSKSTGEFDMMNFDLWDDDKFDKLIMNDYPKKIDLQKRAD